MWKSSKHILYINPEPEDKLTQPINDELTKVMELALSRAKTYTRFKGWHRTKCGEKSSCSDYQLENGMITNSLATFYLRWYRYSISEDDMLKVQELKEYYDNIGELPEIQKVEKPVRPRRFMK
jgi:hypothetical protein